MIFKGYYPDISIPEVSLPEFVLHRARELGDKPALIDGPSGRTLTYGQLAGAVSRLAVSLTERGFKKGDTFAIYSPNVPEYAIAFLGVASLGGINTTINPLYTARELANQLNDSRAKFLLTVPPFMDKALEAAKEVIFGRFLSLAKLRERRLLPHCYKVRVRRLRFSLTRAKI